MALSPLNQRRWTNFKRNKRALWSLIIFSVLFTGCHCSRSSSQTTNRSLCSYRGEIYASSVQILSRERSSAAISGPRRSIQIPRCGA